MAKNDQKNTAEKEKLPQKRPISWKIRFVILCVLAAVCCYGYYQIKVFLNNENNADIQTILVENEINVKIKNLEQRINNLETFVADSLSVPHENEVSPDFEKRFNELRHEALDQINKSLSAQTNNASAEISTHPTSREVLLASGAMIIRDLAEKGLPFAYESEVLQILAKGNDQAQKYADTIQKYAAAGLYGKEHLTTAFNNIYPTLNLSDIKPSEEDSQNEDIDSDAGWQTKVWHWIKKIVLHHKKTPQPEFNKNTDRVYTLVNESRFAEALQLIKTDANYSAIQSPALEEWIKTTQTYLDFEVAVSGLIMNSLANIHLKEFEH